MKQKNRIKILLGNQIDYEKIEKLVKKKEKILLKIIIFIFYECSAKIILILVNQLIF
jgi:hypothetical protein